MVYLEGDPVYLEVGYCLLWAEAKACQGQSTRVVAVYYLRVMLSKCVTLLQISCFLRPSAAAIRKGTKEQRTKGRGHRAEDHVPLRILAHDVRCL